MDPSCLNHFDEHPPSSAYSLALKVASVIVQVATTTSLSAIPVPLSNATGMIGIA